MKALSSMIGLILTVTTSVMAQLEPPTTRVLDCTTGGCHAKKIDYEVLHGPAAATACNVCHEYADAAQHQFMFKREGADLCNFCHVGKTDLGGMSVHKPVEEEKCISCHNPHGSNRRFMLSGETNAAMCLSCHSPLVDGRDLVHSPIQKGDCLNCHMAHSSLHDKLLIEPAEQLCKQCHASVFAPILAAQSAELRFAADPEATPAPTPYVHAPVEQGCTVCHETHASNHASLLKEAPMELCGSCHEPTLQIVEHAQMKHSVVTGDRACLNCHTPHHSMVPHLMIDETLQVCLECHAQNIPRENGTYVTSLADLLEPDAKLHDPVANGECRSCHNPHGAQYAYLLNQPFPREFYQEFSQETYALCFSCHDSTLATIEETDHATNFRNGLQNLHYLHVTAQGEAGRNCRVCHSVHASQKDHLVRTTVPFGEWEVPINYLATTTGGSCAAGCHRAYRYDRVNPVVNLQPKPAPIPPPVANP